jgi:hypothetical protein
MGAAVLGAAALAPLFVPGRPVTPSAEAQDVIAMGELPMEVDYDAFWAAGPEMRLLSEQAQALALDLHGTMDALRQSEKDVEKSKSLRAEVNALLAEYKARKVRLIALIDRIIKTPPPRFSDIDLLKRLRNTELTDISWNKRKFIDCLRDIGKRLRVNFVMHYDMNKFNTVELDFPQSTADGILRTICAGFEAEYIVHNGEICIIKRLKRNDERLLRYFDKHPEWKYWEPKPETDLGNDEDL